MQESRLLLLVLLLPLLALLPAAEVNVNNSTSGERSVAKVCDTKQCKILAASYKSSLNRSVNPCDNFFDFVCGGWKGKNADLSTPDAGGRKQSNTMLKKIAKLADDYIDGKSIALHSDQQLASVFVTCLETAQYSERMKNVARLYELLNEAHLTSWLSDVPSEKFNIIESIVILRLKYGFALPILEPSIRLKGANINKKDLFLTSVPTARRKTSPLPYYKYDSWDMSFCNDECLTKVRRALIDVRATYLKTSEKKIISTLMAVISPDWPSEKVHRITQNIYAAGSIVDLWRRSFSRNVTDVSLKELGRLTSFHWSGTLNRAVGNKFKFDQQYTVTVDNIIAVKHITQILQDAEVAEIFSDYLTAYLIYSFTEHIDLRFLGSAGTCLKIVPNFMPLSYRSLFLREMSANYEESDVDFVINKVKHEMTHAILGSVWMDYAERGEMLKNIGLRLNTIRHREHIMFDNFTEFPNIVFEGTLLNRLLAIRGVVADSRIAELREINPKSMWDWRYPRTTKAVENFPFYIPYVPHMFNIAGVGFAVAHQLAIVIYTQSMWFKIKKNESVSHEQTRVERRRLVNCISEQYYSRRMLNSSKITLDEYGFITIADAGAMRAIWNAYQSLKEQRQYDFILEGLEWLTPEQLFLVRWAYEACPISGVKSPGNQDYLPISTRVNDVMTNLEDFHSVFKCKPNDRMLAKKHCKIW